MKHTRVCVWMAVAVLLLLAPVALGAQPPQIDEFRALSPEEVAAGQEQIPAAQLVFAAYAVVWLAFAFYLFSLWRRITQVEGELRVVAAKLEKSAR